MAYNLTVGERVLIHISQYSRFKEQFEAPDEISQLGIAHSVGISRAHAAVELKKLKEGNKISEKVSHVRGAKSKKKVYFLTLEGEEEIRALRRFSEERTVSLKHGIKMERMSGKAAFDWFRKNTSLSESHMLMSILSYDVLDVDEIKEQSIQSEKRDKYGVGGKAKKGAYGDIGNIRALLVPERGYIITKAAVFRRPFSKALFADDPAGFKYLKAEKFLEKAPGEGLYTFKRELRAQVLEEASKALLKKAHSSVADYYLGIDDMWERLHHLVSCNRIPEAVRLAIKYGPGFEESGRSEEFRDVVEQLRRYDLVSKKKEYKEALSEFFPQPEDIEGKTKVKSHKPPSPGKKGRDNGRNKGRAKKPKTVETKR